MKHLSFAIFILLSTLFLGSSAMAESKTALFAGGCFWCVQPVFDNTKGVSKAIVGYTGGEKKTATYEQVSMGNTGHVEAIEVTYDPAVVKYETLVRSFLHDIDPTDADGQFADRGSQYHTAIFYADPEQKNVAEKELAAIAPKFAPTPIAVKVLPAKPFYAAEDYHQQYYIKNSQHYNAYKKGSGRADYIEKTWK